MTKEELIEFFKENLTVETRVDFGSFDEGSSIHIKLCLSGEEFTSDFVYLPVGD